MVKTASVLMHLLQKEKARMEKELQQNIAALRAALRKVTAQRRPKQLLDVGMLSIYE